jgi:hypothetical protein
MITYNPEPLYTYESIQPTKIRPHFYSFLYDCRIPADFDIGKQPYNPGEMGYLAWHDKFPDNMIPVHHVYKRFFGKQS